MSRPPGPPEDLNLKQVARLLGVHYMTAYRYVRNGQLPARRQGQIWLVDPTDVEDFRRDRPATGAAHTVDWPDRLRRRLLAGDEVGAWTVVTDALSAGHTPQACHLDLLARAMVLSGPNRGFDADGRVAMTTAMRLVARLGATFRHRGRCRGTVVVGTARGDHDGLRVAIIANLFRLNGVAVRELGTDAPPAAFVQSCRVVHDLVAVTIGVSRAELLPSVHEVVEAVRRDRGDLPVLISAQAGSGLEEVPPLNGSLASVADVAETVLAISRLAGRRPDPPATASP